MTKHKRNRKHGKKSSSDARSSDKSSDNKSGYTADDDTFVPKRPARPPGHFDPNDDLPKEDLERCETEAKKYVTRTHDKELSLEKSRIRVPGQEWVLVSFVGEQCRQKTKQLGMKVWGCFDTIEQAKNQADKINQDNVEKIFDVYILEMYTWAVVPPDRNCIHDQKYHEEKLDKLIESHKIEQEKARQVFDLRKKKLQDNPDANQYERNKREIMKLMGETPKETETNDAARDAILGKPEPMPKLEIEIVDPNGDPNGDSTTGADAALPKDPEKDPEGGLNENVPDHPFNEKFYNP